MQTLEEFMKDKELGKVKIRTRIWSDERWFMPMYKSGISYVGFTESDPCERWVTECCANWELFEEPQPKVMRAQYWYKGEGATIPKASSGVYKNDAEFLENFPCIEWYERQEERACKS